MQRLLEGLGEATSKSYRDSSLSPRGCEGFGALSVPVEAHDQPVMEPDNDGQREVRDETRMPHRRQKFGRYLFDGVEAFVKRPERPHVAVRHCFAVSRASALRAPVTGYG